mmetsp:Transcript_31854/g.58877  ORF Transcript_31854/g.58877 Transcript_31854/m.58877 type:complete len:88 (+) Transcript_31854:93-356(+)
MKYLNPGGYFCMIDFAAKHQGQYKGFHSHLSQAASSSIGIHDGFSTDFLVHFYANQLGLKNVQVHPACPLKCEEDEYPTVIVYGQKT